MSFENKSREDLLKHVEFRLFELHYHQILQIKQHRPLTLRDFNNLILANVVEKQPEFGFHDFPEFDLLIELYDDAMAKVPSLPGGSVMQRMIDLQNENESEIVSLASKARVSLSKGETPDNGFRLEGGVYALKIGDFTAHVTPVSYTIYYHVHPGTPKTPVMAPGIPMTPSSMTPSTPMTPSSMAPSTPMTPLSMAPFDASTMKPATPFDASTMKLGTAKTLSNISSVTPATPTTKPSMAPATTLTNDTPGLVSGELTEEKKRGFILSLSDKKYENMLKFIPVDAVYNKIKMDADGTDENSIYLKNELNNFEPRSEVRPFKTKLFSMVTGVDETKNTWNVSEYTFSQNELSDLNALFERTRTIAKPVQTKTSVLDTKISMPLKHIKSNLLQTEIQTLFDTNQIPNGVKDAEWIRDNFIKQIPARDEALLKTPGPELETYRFIWKIADIEYKKSAFEARLLTDLLESDDEFKKYPSLLETVNKNTMIEQILPFVKATIERTNNIKLKSLRLSNFKYFKSNDKLVQFARLKFPHKTDLREITKTMEEIQKMTVSDYEKKRDQLETFIKDLGKYANGNIFKDPRFHENIKEFLNDYNRVYTDVMSELTKIRKLETEFKTKYGQEDTYDECIDSLIGFFKEICK